MSRNMVNGVLAGLFGFFILGAILSVGFSLPMVLRQITGRFNVVPVLNVVIIFFFLLEMMYRFFLQKLSVIELRHYLHLPVGRPVIVRFLLLRSFISPYNSIALLLFTPFCVMEVAKHYGADAAALWLINIVLISWSIHWLMVWYKQKYKNSLVSFFVLLGIFMGVGGAIYYQWLNIRYWVEPLFSGPLIQPLWMLIPALLFIGSCLLVYHFYRRNAYLETLGSQTRWKNLGQSWSFFDGFGTAGTFADLELKLIIRHKKSRVYLFISLIFLAYGLIFYTNDSFNVSSGISWTGLAVGILITGMFIVQYGQLYLSWNSPYFDFFISRRDGLQKLITGKYVLFVGISLVCFIITIPYVYFGKDILLVHSAAFLFNIGINIHVIVWMALWKPKPMDLNRSSMFNYEGVGLAQFLMALPVIGLPYAIYLPVNYVADQYTALITLALVGVCGILFHRKIIAMQVGYIHKKRYEISASFRQEI